jgi:hypothetical protein
MALEGGEVATGRKYVIKYNKIIFDTTYVLMLWQVCKRTYKVEVRCNECL